MFAFFFEGRVVSPLYGLAFCLTLGGLLLYHRAPPPTFASTHRAPLVVAKSGENGDRAARFSDGGTTGDGAIEDQNHEPPPQDRQSPLHSPE